MTETDRGVAASPGASETGRYLVVLDDEVFGDAEAAASALREVAEPSTGSAPLNVESVLFAELGVAVVTVGPGGVEALRARAAADPRIAAVEPERRVRMTGGLSPEYLRGFRDAASRLYDEALAVAGEQEAERAHTDTETLTWGLQATGAATSPAGGAGVRVAILDTGLDLTHPDYAARDVLTASFVAGETVQDGNGHGTHTAGTACGPLAPAGTQRRYGVAHQAELMVGKVLSDSGSGTDSGVLAGMSWAIAGGARVISMSLGSDVAEVSTTYETVGRRALAAGVLIIAAAGNNASRDQGDPGFVGVPANSPSIMAVGAVDQDLALAPFSAGSSGVEGGQVDLVAPGVEVYSTSPQPQLYDLLSGTSMATPHVAGIAALWSETTGATGSALWAQLVQAARRLPLPSADVGAGIAQAPQA